MSKPPSYEKSSGKIFQPLKVAVKRKVAQKSTNNDFSSSDEDSTAFKNPAKKFKGKPTLSSDKRRLQQLTSNCKDCASTNEVKNWLLL